MKRAIIILLVVAVMGMWGCKKKEEPPAERVTPGQPFQHTPVMIPQGSPTVVVPDEVKGAWSAVKLKVTDKEANTTREVTVQIGDEYSIPDTGLKIKIEQFLPDFKMDGLTITSASNEPNNPAARVIIYESGKEVFRGWLYSKFPTIHPFTHERYSITLVEGIKKKS